MQPMILCLGMDEGKMMRLSFLASSLGIAFKTPPADGAGWTLGMLCGLDPAAGRAEMAAIPGEMLVMANLTDGQMDRLLRTLRESGCSVPLKAVLTPYNRFWTPRQLYRELMKEAASFGGGPGQTN